MKFEVSHAALMQRQPELAAMIGRPESSCAVVSDGVLVDIVIDQQRFYGGDARAVATDQVSEFMNKPRRLAVSSLIHHKLESKIEVDMFSRMSEACRSAGTNPADLPSMPSHEGSALIILGLGLGYQLESLLERTGARYLIIIEPNPQLLSWSLEALEWKELAERLESADGTMRICSGADLNATANWLLTLLRGEAAAAVDGAWVFIHYAHPMLIELWKRMNELSFHAFSSWGYYEDERLMLAQSIANMRHKSFRMLTPGHCIARQEPVILVGSGPSLQQTIADIKQIRHGAIVISCSTALQALLVNGIVPDFLCEYENHPLIYELVADARDRFGLDGITLIGSLTLDPRVLPMFNDAIMFWREASVATKVFGRSCDELPLTMPTVANAALSAAIELGFSDIYLFGIDLGSVDQYRKHAPGTIYDSSVIFQKMYESTCFNIRRPGNFGGEIYTWSTFDLSRQAISALIEKNPGITVTNCSNGLFIDGTIPRRASDVRLKTPEIDRSEIIIQIISQVPAGNGNKLIELMEFPSRHVKILDQIQQIERLIDIGERNHWPLSCLWMELYRSIDFNDGMSMIEETAKTLIKIATLFVNRIGDGKQREVVYRAFFAAYRDSISVIREDIGSIFGSEAKN